MKIFIDTANIEQIKKANDEVIEKMKFPLYLDL